MGASTSVAILSRIGVIVIPFTLLLCFSAMANEGERCGGDDHHASKGKQYGHHPSDSKRDGHRSRDQHQEAGHRSDSDFPGVGYAFELGMDDSSEVARVYFDSTDKLSFTPGPGARAMPVRYSYKELGNGSFIIGWYDDAGRPAYSTLDFDNGWYSTQMWENGEYRSYDGSLTMTGVSSRDTNVDWTVLDNSRSFAFVWPDYDYTADDWDADQFYESTLRQDWQGEDSRRVGVASAQRGTSEWSADSRTRDEERFTSSFADPAQMEGDYVEAAGSSGYNNSNLNCRAMLSKQMSLSSDMRQLWQNHVTLTRFYIISSVEGLSDKGEVNKQMMQNQVDIGNSLIPFYGNTAASRVTQLLQEHMSIADSIITAAKAKDNAKLATLKSAWSANANSLADYLSSANPDFWPSATIGGLLQDHLNLTSAELKARLAGDWSEDLDNFARVMENSNLIADSLSSGIVGQFPDRF